MRFMYGVNYAWSADQFGQDFGGLAAWGRMGVAQNRAQRLADLQDMKDHGVSVVRWWIFPVFWGDGVAKDSEGVPTGLGGTALKDLAVALDIAAEVGLYLQPTLFSFDNFRKDKDIDARVKHRSIAPLVKDSSRRKRLMDNLVRPFARAVATSPNADRVVSWDVINEPEWAVTGTTPYGDPKFDPQSNLETVAFNDMETFVKETVAALKAESAAPVTVGGAAIKWPKAWSRCDLDFYTYHLYDWVNQYYPHDRSPESYGVTDKPSVMGEFPLAGLTGVPYGTVVDNLLSKGWAGAMGWAVTDGPWSTSKAEVKAFATANPFIDS